MYIVLLAKFYNINNEIESLTLSTIIRQVLVDGGFYRTVIVLAHPVIVSLYKFMSACPLCLLDIYLIVAA